MQYSHYFMEIRGEENLKFIQERNLCIFEKDSLRYPTVLTIQRGPTQFKITKGSSQ